MAKQLLVGMLDQAAGVHGYAQTGDRQFLESYTRGRKTFEAALRAGQETGSNRDVRTALAEQTRAARAWQADAADAIDTIARRGTAAVTLTNARRRNALLDDFRRKNTALQGRLEALGNAQLARAGYVSVAVILGLGVLFAGGGQLLLGLARRTEERRLAAERVRRDSQREFTDAMLLTRTEREAQELLTRHLERSLPGVSALVLSRNETEERLEATPSPERSLLWPRALLPPSSRSVLPSARELRARTRTRAGPCFSASSVTTKTSAPPACPRSCRER